MAASKCEISRCGLCRFYVHEGRRGGVCSQLNVPVSSQWKSCRLAVSPFQSEAISPAAETVSEVLVGINRWASSKAIAPDTIRADVKRADANTADTNRADANSPKDDPKKVVVPHKIALKAKAHPPSNKGLLKKNKTA